MGVDYYGVLKVDKAASYDECKKAYRRLAMKWHPDKHPEDKETAQSRIKHITEAYEVLCDDQRREIYNNSGEEGLRGQFQPREAMEVFQEVFGFSSPLVATGNERTAAGDIEDAVQKVLKMVREPNLLPAIQLNVPPPIERKLQCTLEELYSGSVRKVKISRTETDESGRTMPVEETLTIEVKPGWKAGTRVRFPGKGSRQADVEFVIEAKPHAVMRREGDDLVVLLQVELVDALTGYAAEVSTLDGRALRVPCVEILRPGSQVVVKEEGMPVPVPPPHHQQHPDDFDYHHRRSTASASSTAVAADPAHLALSSGPHELGQQVSTSVCGHNGDRKAAACFLGGKQYVLKKRGDLRLQFDIVFPAHLSPQQKAVIRHALTQLK